MNFISITEEAVYNTHVVNIYLSELSRGWSSAVEILTGLFVSEFTTMCIIV